MNWIGLGIVALGWASWTVLVFLVGFGMGGVTHLKEADGTPKVQGG